jgi:hypothetical protein
MRLILGAWFQQNTAAEDNIREGAVDGDKMCLWR